MALDLYKLKERRESVLNLKKSVGLDGQLAEVVLCLDYSGSMSGLYGNGTVQQTIERILPLGLGFDDNGEVDLYLFSNKYNRVPTKVTLKNLDNFLANHITGRYQMGGTSYAPIIRAITEDYAQTSGGFLGIGAKPAVRELPVYVIFITDGENDDREGAELAIREASRHGIFFQFVGIGSEKFNFLTKLDNLPGRVVDNANFFKVPDLGRVSDDELYRLLMTEFPQFIIAAKSANLLR